MIRNIVFVVFVLALCSCSNIDEQTDAGPMPVDAGHSDADVGSTGPSAYWTAIPANAPRMRQHGKLAFDPISQRLIFLGGCSVWAGDGCSATYDIWVLDLSDGLAQAEWTQMFPAGEAPGIITQWLAIAYDTATGRLLVALSGADALELWAIEDANGLGSPQWTRLPTTGMEPPLRRSFAPAIHDPNRNRLYLYGGIEGPDDITARGDGWVLENANGVDGPARWRALSQEGVQPEPRAFYSVAFTPSRSRMFMFGGADNAGSFFSDGWSLDLEEPVTARRIIDVLPRPLVKDVVGYRARRQTILFLGCRDRTARGYCRFDAIWHLGLRDGSEPLREVGLLLDEDAPFDPGGDHISLYDAGNDRFFLFTSSDESGTPLDVLWVLSNASAG